MESKVPFETFSVIEDHYFMGRFIVATRPYTGDGEQQRAFIEAAIREKLERESKEGESR